MADANTTIDLSALHQAILDAIAAQFLDVSLVADYRDDRKRLPLPAILVELADMEANPEEDPGTGQLPVLARWEARIIIGFRTPDAEREIRKLAGALGVYAHQNRWGLPVGPAEVLTITPHDFDPDLDQYVVWRVEWQQALHLGATVWANDGTIPATVLYSYAPEIGPENESRYQEVGQ